MDLLIFIFEKVIAIRKEQKCLKSSHSRGIKQNLAWNLNPELVITEGEWGDVFLIQPFGLQHYIDPKAAKDAVEKEHLF